LKTLCTNFEFVLKTYLQPKGKKASSEPPTHADVFVADCYPPWQAEIISELKKVYKTTGNMPDNKQLSQTFQNNAEVKKYMKKVMPFVQVIKESFSKNGEHALDLTYEFDAADMLSQNIKYLKNTLGLTSITILPASEGSEKVNEECLPGKPFIVFKSPEVAQNTNGVASMKLED